MLTGLDHIVIGVRNMERAMESFRRLGFHAYPGGEHPGRGTHNAVVLFDADYFGLIAPQDVSLEGGQNLLASIEANGEGIRTFVVGSDDLATDVRALRERGVALQDPRPSDRRTPEGLHLEWMAANLSGSDALPLYFNQHMTPVDVRKTQAPARAPHPNGALRIGGVAIAVQDVAAAGKRYEQVLGRAPGPEHEDATWGGRAVVYSFPEGAVLLVRPEGKAGPAAEALAARGEGPFGIAVRVQNPAATLRYHQEHGTAVYADAVSAVVTRPEAAHGVWLAWVG